jgi:hypothetical protein
MINDVSRVNLDSSPFRVWYITISFPAPSETFACVEMQALIKLGVAISVRSLGTVSRKSLEMLGFYELEHLDCRSFSWLHLPWEFWQAIRHPFLTLSLVLTIIATMRLRPRELLRSLCLVPRSIMVFLEIERERPDIVHLFWGHYLCLVGWLIDRFLPQQGNGDS